MNIPEHPAAMSAEAIQATWTLDGQIEFLLPAGGVLKCSQAAFELLANQGMRFMELRLTVGPEQLPQLAAEFEFGSEAPQQHFRLKDAVLTRLLPALIAEQTTDAWLQADQAALLRLANYDYVGEAVVPEQSFELFA